ncbi:MAG: protein of unknown function rane [Actinomycetia bacterium]|nr:protein of unknown function rane [Actinomycetes bacterium]
MLEELSRDWWVLTVRGVFAILFGLVAWIWPQITVLALLLLFGAYALVDGAVLAGSAVRGGRGPARTWLIGVGIVGILIGIMTLIWPAETGYVLLIIIASWAMVLGALQIVTAVLLRKELPDEWFLIITGAISVIFGLLLFLWPAKSVIAVIWIIGLFSLIFGVAMVTTSLRLRKLGRTLSQL